MEKFDTVEIYGKEGGTFFAKSDTCLVEVEVSVRLASAF
jgi:phage-related protein